MPSKCQRLRGWPSETSCTSVLHRHLQSLLKVLPQPFIASQGVSALGRWEGAEGHVEICRYYFQQCYRTWKAEDGFIGVWHGFGFAVAPGSAPATGSWHPTLPTQALCCPTVTLPQMTVRQRVVFMVPVTSCVFRQMGSHVSCTSENSPGTCQIAMCF